MNAAAVLRVIVEAQTGPASASLAKFDGQLAATAANADRSLGRVVGSTEKVVTAGKRMQATGRTITGVGKAIGLATVPLALFGAESVKMGLNFRRQMGLVATDAGGTAREVKKLEHSVLGLARTSQFAPQQLAESLFHVESSGYRGAKAMKVLNEAQKLATTGNSDLQTTTYALVSATKALYGESLTNVNRTAAELNGIVAHGDMRLEELTAAMSTGVIPKGKAMGLTLQDIGAAMDVMTSRGIPAQRAAYALGFTLQKLIPYGEKAEDAFKSIGLGEEELIKTAQHGKFGYVSALEDLQRHLDQLPTKAQQTKVIEEMFGGGRMTSGLLTNLQNLGEMRKIYRELGDEVGKYNRHVKEAEEQPLVKMKAAWSSIQADMVEIGGDLLPVIVPGFEHLVHLADGAMHGFASLPPGLQSAAVEAGLITIGLSGGLIVTGKLITAVGTLREAMAGLAVVEAGGALFGDLKAASTLALGGELGGFRMLGADAAKGMMGGLTRALPGLAATAGLGTIIYSATQGDWEGVGVEAGGALVGGIAGAFIGNPLLGAGIGAAAGGLLRSIFAGASHHAETLAQAMGRLQEASQGLHRSEGALRAAKERERDATRGQSRAEQHLQDLRQSHAGTGAIHRAELNVIESRQHAKRATDAVRRSEEHLEEFRALKGEKAGVVFHRASLYIAKEQEHLNHLKRLIQEEGKTPELAAKREEALKRLIGWEHQRNVALEAARKFNRHWAESLENMDTVQQRFGTNGIVLVRRLQEQSEHLADLKQKVQGVPRDVIPPSWRSDLERTEAKLGHTRQAIENFSTRTGTSLGGASGAVAKFSGDSSASYESLAETAGLAMQNIIANTAGASKALGAGPIPSFSLKTLSRASQYHHQREATQTGLGRQSGGIVPGNSSGDRHFRLLPQDSFVMNRNATEHFGFQNGGMVPTMLESRERVFYPSEVATLGLGNLMMMNAAVPRQKGGSIGPEPQLAGPAGPLRGVGQAAIHQIYKGAEAYLAKHKPTGGSHSYNGHTLSGKVSWFNGGATAGGSDTSRPGVALNLHPGTESGWDNKITRGFMADSLAGHPDYIRLTIQGHTAVLPITDLGPAGFTHRAIDVTEGGVRKLGISTGAFPTDAIGRAVFLQVGGGVGSRDATAPRDRESWQRYISNARKVAHEAWHALGRSNVPAPSIVFDSGSAKGAPYVRVGTRRVHIPVSMAGDLWKGKGGRQNYIRRALVHEFAHTMQKDGILSSIPEREGGAAWFANIESPGVWRKVGLAYSQPDTTGAYATYLNRVQHEHNRDWAMHGQFKKFQRGGSIGSGAVAGDGIKIVHPKWEPQFQDWMHGVWGRAKGLYGASGPAPDLFLARGLAGEMGLAGLEQAGTVEMAPGYARGAMHGGYGQGTLLHEWAHVFQRRGLPHWEREGGATAFSRWAGPRVFGSGFDLRWPGGHYRPWTEAVIAKRGMDWVKRGQFLQKGGLVGLAAGGSPSGGKPLSTASLPVFLRSGGTGPADATHVVKWAQAHLGQTRDYGYPGEWCGAFVGADMQAHGIQPPSGYPLAANWAGWGTGDSSPLYGDVVVIGGSGHVGIAMGGNKMISGNFSNKVAESTIGEAAGGRPILGYRTPPYTHTDSKNPHETKAQEVAHTYKESVPAVYHGCRTDSLHFGSMPKTLHGVEREISKRQGELGQYRRVAKLAAEKNRPAIAQALKHNITALEARLKQLRDERTKLRREVVKKRFSKKLHRTLSGISGYEQLIEAKQRDYNIASQNVEQIVGLEPQEPILGSGVSEAKRAEAEKAYVAAYESYVNGTERPAFQDVLGKEADWRNTILRAEYFGFGKGKPSVAGMEWHWEKSIYEVDSQIDAINQYSERVKADIATFKQQHPKAKELPDWIKKEIAEREKKRAQLPTLRFKDKELRTVLGEGRSLFFPGVTNGPPPISPPSPPLPGTGSFEDALIEVQGIHWPDQHSLLPASALAPPRVAGRFGGAIWDTQASIEELGLKIQQVSAGIGGSSAGGTEGKSEREQLLETLLNQARQREAINVALGPTLAQFESTYPFMGAFAKGGVALVGETGPEIAHFPSGTRIHSADDTRRMLGGHSSPTILVIEQLHVHSDGRVTASSKDSNLRVAVKEIIDDTRSPMPTPGSFGAGFRP